MKKLLAILIAVTLAFSSCSRHSYPEQSSYYETYVDSTDYSQVVYVNYGGYAWFMSYSAWLGIYPSYGYAGCYDYYIGHRAACDGRYNYYYNHSYSYGHPEVRPSNRIRSNTVPYRANSNNRPQVNRNNNIGNSRPRYSAPRQGTPNRSVAPQSRPSRSFSPARSNSAGGGARRR